MKKAIISLLLAVALVGGGYAVYKNQTQKTNVQAVQYVPIKVEKRTIEKAITGSGSVESSSVTSIQAQDKETVSEVLVSQNTPVKAGDTIVKFTSGDYITAPADGIITSISANVGQNVNAYQEVAKLTNDKNLVTKISVNEIDLSSIAVGQSATINVSAFPKESFTGKVKSISSIGTYSNGVTTFDVYISFDDIKSIKIGMSTAVKITLESKKDVLSLPIDAVKSTGQQKVVLVKDAQGKQVNKTVETGTANDTYVEITSGLNEGDEVYIAKMSTTNQSGGNLYKGMQGGMRQSGGQGGSQFQGQGGGQGRNK